MAARASVTMTTSLDVGDLMRRLTDAERKVIVGHATIILKAIKKRWRGWEYDGRPKGAPVNVSLKAWQSTIQSTENPFRVEIANEARAYKALGGGAYSVPAPGGPGDGYSAYVHRSGDSTPEVEYIAEEIRTKYAPAMKADLIAAIKATLDAPAQRKKLRRGSTGPRRRAAALVS